MAQPGGMMEPASGLHHSHMARPQGAVEDVKLPPSGVEMARSADKAPGTIPVKKRISRLSRLPKT